MQQRYDRHGRLIKGETLSTIDVYNRRLTSRMELSSQELTRTQEEAWEKLDKMGEGGREEVAAGGAKTKKSLLGSLHEKLICSAKDSDKPVA